MKPKLDCPLCSVFMVRIGPARFRCPTCHSMFHPYLGQREDLATPAKRRRAAFVQQRLKELT